MSKIGKKTIEIPKEIAVVIEDKKIKVKGPKGELQFEIPREIKIVIENDVLSVVLVVNSKKTPALWGTLRAVIANMIIGVSKGFEKKLEIEGVGFKVQSSGENLLLNLGFSHPVVFKTPAGIKISVEKNIITIAGISKELVGQTAAKIRALKEPEPFKGKGIRYVGEIIKRKSGKKVSGTAS